jgi:hypothetical protein
MVEDESLIHDKKPQEEVLNMDEHHAVQHLKIKYMNLEILFLLFIVCHKGMILTTYSSALTYIK